MSKQSSTDTASIRVGVADKSPLIQAALTHLFSENSRFELVKIWADGDAMLQEVDSCELDVAVTGWVIAPGDGKYILDHFAIKSHFDVVVGGDTASTKKPDPLPLQICLDGLDVAASDCLMIGDSAVDVAAARAVGMPVAVVCHGYANAPVTSLGADFIISDFSRLPASLAACIKKIA